MMTFDLRTIGTAVYEALRALRQPYQDAWDKAHSDSEKKIYYDHLKEQKNQAVELYTFLATWGLMRLKAEEISLDKTKLGETATTNLKKKAETSQEGKREVLQAYFACLQNLSDISPNQTLSGKQGLETLKNIQPPEAYLGMTGLGLQLAQEFGFWATAVYHDIKGED